MERDYGWDGGWEEAVDEGEGLEDFMLGPVAPHDLPSSYVPAERWGSRHEISRRPFADPVDLVENGEMPTGRRPTKPVRDATTPPPTRRQNDKANAEAPKPIGRPSRAATDTPPPAASTAALKKPLTEKRRALVARCAVELGISESTVRIAVFSGCQPIWADTELTEVSAKAIRNLYARLSAEDKRDRGNGDVRPGKRRKRPMRTNRPGVGSFGTVSPSRPPKKRPKGGQRVFDGAPSNPPLVCNACQQGIRIDGRCGCS